MKLVLMVMSSQSDRNLITNKLNEYFVNIGPSLAHEVEKIHSISADQTTIGDLDNRPNSIFHLLK